MNFFFVKKENKKGKKKEKDMIQLYKNVIKDEWDKCFESQLLYILDNHEVNKSKDDC